MRTIPIILLFIIVIVIVTACNINDTNDNNEITYDPLLIEFIYPDNNTIKFPVNHKFIIKFNDEVLAYQLDSYISINEVNGDSIKYSAESTDIRHSNNKTIIITPASELKPDTEYILNIPTSLKNRNNTKKIKNQLIYTFKTAVDNDIPAGIILGRDTGNPTGTTANFEKNVVSISFNELLNPLLIYTNTIGIKIYNKIKTTYDDITTTRYYDLLTNTVFIYPDTSLLDGELYMLWFRKDIEDLGGNKVGNDQSEEFSF